MENIGFFDKWFFKPIGTIQMFNPFEEYRKEYKATKEQYIQQLNLINEYQRNYKILNVLIDNIVQILLKNNTFKQNISKITDTEPLFTIEYVKKLNSIIIDMIYKDKYSHIRSELYAIKRLTEKVPKINKDAVIRQQFQPLPPPAFQPAQLPKPPSPAPAPIPAPTSPPRRAPAPAMQPIPAQQFKFTPSQQDAVRRFMVGRGGRKTKK